MGIILYNIIMNLRIITMSIKHFVAYRLDSENALYRGKVIELRNHIPTGYHGRYKVGIKHMFSTQKQAKEYIDSLCLERGIDSFMSTKETNTTIAEWKF